MKTLAVALALAVALLGALAGIAWYMLTPRPASLPLPAALVALDTPEGQAMLARSVRADHDRLAPHFTPQIYTSYCGVASSVIALDALGVPSAQAAFFTEAAEAVRGRWATLFGGMPLADLAGLVAAHGVQAVARHGDTLDVDALRALLRADLARAEDVILVNYERAAVGQVPGGHISPVTAYDPASDRALVLDTAAHRYPPVWIEVEALHRAMNSIDADSGRPRGLVRIGPRAD